MLVYFTIMALSIAGIIYGLTNLGSVELKVLHERQPLFVTQSDGSIQNKYELKILNKTEQDMHMRVTASGHDHLQLIGADEPLTVPPGRVSAFTIFLRIPGEQLNAERTAVTIKLEDISKPEISASYKSMFFGPKH